MNSLWLVIVLVISASAQIWDDDDDEIAETTTESAFGCKVSGEDGICVESMLYCKTPHTGIDKITWRSSPVCRVGVCCKVSDVISKVTGAGDMIPSTTESPVATSTPRTCGIQKLQTVPGFVKTKSNEADPGEFPWTISLMTVLNSAITGNKNKYIYTGTGSLIHDRVVLTAARVLMNTDTDRLRAAIGEHDQTRRVLPKKVVEVEDVVVHNNFHSGNGDNNYALVFLKASATFGLPHVGTICLPSANYVATPGMICAFSGWGEDANKNLQLQLTKTVAPMMDHPACEQRLQRNPDLGPGFELLQSFVCAGGEEGKDLCGGDRGSPLVCPIEGDPERFVQTGIVSWMADACELVAFADVAKARTWIDQQMIDRQYSTESYQY